MGSEIIEYSEKIHNLYKQWEQIFNTNYLNSDIMFIFTDSSPNALILNFKYNSFFHFFIHGTGISRVIKKKYFRRIEKTKLNKNSEINNDTLNTTLNKDFIKIIRKNKISKTINISKFNNYKNMLFSKISTMKKIIQMLRNTNKSMPTYVLKNTKLLKLSPPFQFSFVWQNENSVSVLAFYCIDKQKLKHKNLIPVSSLEFDKDTFKKRFKNSEKILITNYVFY